MSFTNRQSAGRLGEQILCDSTDGRTAISCVLQLRASEFWVKAAQLHLATLIKLVSKSAWAFGSLTVLGWRVLLSSQLSLPRCMTRRTLVSDSHLQSSFCATPGSASRISAFNAACIIMLAAFCQADGHGKALCQLFVILAPTTRLHFGSQANVFYWASDDRHLLTGACHLWLQDTMGCLRTSARANTAAVTMPTSPRPWATQGRL